MQILCQFSILNSNNGDFCILADLSSRLFFSYTPSKHIIFLTPAALRMRGAIRIRILRIPDRHYVLVAPDQKQVFRFIINRAFAILSSNLLRTIFIPSSYHVRSLFDHCSIVVRSLFDRCSIVVRSLFDCCSIAVRLLFDCCSIVVRSLFDCCSIIVR